MIYESSNVTDIITVANIMTDRFRTSDVIFKQWKLHSS